MSALSDIGWSMLSVSGLTFHIRSIFTDGNREDIADTPVAPIV
jgi:hypothetical protein